MGVLPACVSLYHACLVSVETKEDIGSPGTGAADGCEPLLRYPRN